MAVKLLLLYCKTMTKIIKTIQWTAESKGLFALCARTRKLGTATNAKPRNFVEFVAAYPNCDLKSMTDFFRRYLLNDRFKNHDVTNISTLSEDSCLFSTSGSKTETLDTVLSYLNVLNTGGTVPALWAYLDDEEKSIVHFVNNKGFYAELYCLSDENFSVMHLLETGKETYAFVPVIFTTEFPEDIVTKAFMTGKRHLREYLPRERFDLLSKGGKKSSGYPLPGKEHFVAPDTPTSADRWDTL